MTERPVEPYWKCPKDLVDAALRSLAPVDFKIAFAVERKTKGHFEHEDAELSINLLSDLTGLHRNVVARARRRLLAQNVLLQMAAHNNRRGTRLKLNPDVDAWCHLSGVIAEVIQSHPTGDATVTPEVPLYHLSDDSSITAEVPHVSPERCPQKKNLEDPSEDLLGDSSEQPTPADDLEGSSGVGLPGCDPQLPDFERLLPPEIYQRVRARRALQEIDQSRRSPTDCAAGYRGGIPENGSGADPAALPTSQKAKSPRSFLRSGCD